MSPEPSHEHFQLHRMLEQSPISASAFDVLVRAAAHIGFDQIAYGTLSSVETINLAKQPSPAVALNYPMDWRKRYFEKRYYEIDPSCHLHAQYRTLFHVG
jgi:hypothetical protein